MLPVPAGSRERRLLHSPRCIDPHTLLPTGTPILLANDTHGRLEWERAPAAAPRQPRLCSSPLVHPFPSAGSRGKWRLLGAPGRLWPCWGCTCGSGHEERGGAAFPRVLAAWECCASPEAGTSSPAVSLVRALSACVPSDQTGQFSQFQSMGNRNAVVCVQGEPFSLPPLG